MPIIITDREIQWTETTSTVAILVPLRGVNKKNVHVFSSSRYLKVNYPPFLYELFLKASVDPGNSSAQIGDGRVTFRLKKKDHAIWEELSHPEAENEEFRQQERQEALDEHQQQSLEDAKQKCIDKTEREKFSLQQQMVLDELERKRIEQLKEKERLHMTKTVELMKSEVQSYSSSSVIQKSNKSKSTNQNNTESFKLPPPRNAGHIKVTFTQREFPSAARESNYAEEQEWLQKQAAARQAIEIECADLSPEERNPQWLKEKGDNFYSNGDFHGAINAYSLALKMCPSLPSLYSNRAACHLQLRNLHKAIEDSSKALDLLTPPVENNALARLHCHVRRGTAFCNLELYVEALQDYESAYRISPTNEELRLDTEKIRHQVQGSI